MVNEENGRFTTENKNKYILSEEVLAILFNLRKYPDVQKMVRLIYEDGYKINEAYKKAEVKKSFRSCERNIKTASKGLVRFNDLRRSYKLDHPKINKSYKRKPLNPSLRWKILTRDKFRCVVCGATSKQKQLHVDHIYPKSLGGNDKETNLRTLCFECNMGRGNNTIDIPNIIPKPEKEGWMNDVLPIKELGETQALKILK